MPAPLIETLAEAERAEPVTAIGNDRLGSAFVELLAQFGAVIGPVTEQAFRCFDSIDEALSDRAIVRLTAGQ